MKATRRCIEKIFGENHRNVQDFSAIGTGNLVERDRKGRMIQALKECIAELEIEIATRPQDAPIYGAASQSRT